MMILRIAICGPSGAGKTTLANSLSGAFRRVGVRAFPLAIAAPLYAAQQFIYGIAGSPLQEGFQDTQLLAFLGRHVREINSSALIDNFVHRMNECIASVESGSVGAIICSDARRPDLPRLRDLEFVCIYIDAPNSLLLKRIEMRGDANPNQTSPELETSPETIAWDFTIDNVGTIEDLDQTAIGLVADLLGLLS